MSSMKPTCEEAPEEGIMVEAVEEATKGTAEGTIRDSVEDGEQAWRLGCPTTATRPLTLP